MARRPPKPPDQDPQPRHKVQPTTFDKSPSNPRSLSSLYKAFLEESEIPLSKEEVRSGTDRTACIVLSAMVERNLERLVLTRIELGMGMKESLRKKLFDKDGALSTFSGNIKLGRALELYGNRLAKDLDVVRRIRNVFAHTVIPTTFQSEEIRKEIATLRLAVYDERDVDEKELMHVSLERREFTLTCFAIVWEINNSWEMISAFIEETSDALLYWARRFNQHANDKPSP